MDLGVSPRNIENLLEPDPLKCRFLVCGLAVRTGQNNAVRRGFGGAPVQSWAPRPGAQDRNRSAFPACAGEAEQPARGVERKQGQRKSPGWLAGCLPTRLPALPGLAACGRSAYMESTD